MRYRIMNYGHAMCEAAYLLRTVNARILAVDYGDQESEARELKSEMREL